MRLALESDRPVARAARDLGTHPEALRTPGRASDKRGRPMLSVSARAALGSAYGGS